VGLWLVGFERLGCDLEREREERNCFWRKDGGKERVLEEMVLLEYWKVLGLWKELKCMNSK